MQPRQPEVTDSKPRPGRRVYAIIGDPVAQARSPNAFAEYFLQHQIDAVVVPLHVGSQDLKSVLCGCRSIRNLDGAILTIPHKPAAMELAAEIGPLAQACGAANALAPIKTSDWRAEMFDGIGLVTALQKRRIGTVGLSTLIIGAGGAGAAIAFALRRVAKVGAMQITDTNESRARQLAARLDDCVAGPADPAGFQLVINASPCGMATNDCPISTARLERDAVVCDAVMEPPVTRLLNKAEIQGCVTLKGYEMLLGQIEPLLNFFGGIQ